MSSWEKHIVNPRCRVHEMRQHGGFIVKNTDSGGRSPGFDFQELAYKVVGLASLKLVESRRLETLRWELEALVHK